MKPRSRFHFLIALALIQLMLFAPSIQIFADDNQQSLATPILVVNTSFLNIRSGPGANFSIIGTVVGGTELPVIGLYEDEVWYQVATNIGAGWVNREFTVGRGDFSSVPLIEYGSITPVQPTTVTSVSALGQGGVAVPTTTGVTSTDIGIGVFGVSFIGGDFHTAPDSNSPIVAALVPADENRIYPVMNIVYVEGRPYYQVNYPEYGVVWSDRFRPRPMECNGWSVIVAAESVGSIPIGVSNPIEFSPGDEMYVAGPGRDGLIEIVTPDGTRGLVPVDKTRSRPGTIVNYCNGVTPSTGATTVTTNTTVVPSVVPAVVPAVINAGQGGGVVIPSTTAAARLIVNTGNLNIRTGPGANYSILATVPGGTELPVTGLYEDEVWYQVATNIGAGWVNREFTIGRGDFSSVPLIEYGTVTAVQPTTTTSVASLGQGGGAVVPTTSSALTTEIGIGVFGVSFIGGDLHTAPDSNSPIVAALVPADENRIYPVMNIAYVEGRPYYQVNYPEYGVVWSDRFRPRPMECNGWSVIVAAESVGTIPIGVSNPISFNPGDEMYVAGPGRDGLIEIVTADGTRGLVPVDKTRSRPGTIVNYCNGVTPSTGATTVTTTTAVVPGVVPAVVSAGQGGGVVIPSTTAAARLIVNTGNLNIRTGPGANYSILATVPGGTELPVTGLYEDEVWYQVATNIGAGWVNREFTIGRGDFSNVPLIKYGAFTPTVSNGTTVAGVTNVGVASATVNSAARVVVNTPNLNVRTGPSALFSIVATVSGGTELAVLGVADDGVWYLVEGTFGQGWLNNEFVIFRGDYSAVPVLNINP